MSSGCCPWFRNAEKRSFDSDPDDYEYTRVVWKTISNGERIMPVERPNTNQQATSSKAVPQSTPAKGKTSLPSSAFEEECLTAHNRLRALHGCPPLQLNSNLNAVAKKWALSLAKRKTIEHSNNPKYGENLYQITGKPVKAAEAVQAWYDEVQNYNFGKPEFTPQTGHFTQVVWKGTKNLGVAVEVVGNATWVVANYDPPGNVIGAFAENVPKPTRK